jgi:integrase
MPLLSLWPIRRRSITALTVSKHLKVDDDGINIRLFPEDTKAKRAESFRVPNLLLPYLLRYLEEIRPRLLGRNGHDGLWASYKACPLTGCGIYDIVRARTFAKFGKAMGLHDFRRAAATFIAMEAPDKLSIIPSVLQHTSPEVSEQHYNLARSTEASRRFAAYRSKIRDELRPITPRNGG